MKKFLFFALMFFSMVVMNGQATDDNVFRQSENSGSSSSDTPQNGQPVTEEPNSPGNPGGPVPIDQYIPFLLVLAAGLVIYTQRKESGKIY